MRPRFSTFCAIGLLLLVASITARGTPYWVAWEGEDFPENQGWQRFHGPQGAQAIRALADGAMLLDGLNPPVYDYYRIEDIIHFNPDLGETFVMQWRLRVEEVTVFPNDPSVALVSEGSRMVGFSYERDRVRSSLESLYFPFEPDVFHSFELRSSEMHTYTFWLDGILVHNGIFTQSVGPAFVAWGDGGNFAGSRTTWDYFRFGVVPEVSSGVTAAVMGITGLCWSRVHRRMYRSSGRGVCHV